MEQNIALAKAMSIHLIFNKVFDHLSFAEVLNCSLISKNWNDSARAYLRQKRNCLATINGHETCSNMAEFGCVVKNSFNAPYNGLKLKLRKLSDECSSNSEVAQLHPLLREKFVMKHLTIYWTCVTKCPLERLVQELVQDESLESITVTQLPANMISLVRHFHIPMPRSNSWLPNVKSVSFECVPNDIIIFELIAASPQVEHINGKILPHHLAFINHFRKCKSVRDFMFEPKQTDAEMCGNFAQENPVLKFLCVSSYWWYWPAEFFQPMIEILKIITQSSRNTLEGLVADHLNLIWLSNSGLTFPRLTQLTIKYDKNVDEREGYCTLKKIDFCRLFPNLQVVQLWGEHGYREEFPTFHNNYFRNSLDCSAFPCKAEDLRINHVWIWGQQCFQNFGEVFPCVKKLCFESSQRFDYCLPLLWKTWQGVESIKIDTRDILAEENLDALFCGISEEEVAEISSLSPEFLKNYQFAPIRPSLSNLHQLRSMKLNISHLSNKCRDRTLRQSLLSNTTGYLALKRMPKLSMKISRNVCLNNSRNRFCVYRMDDLKPFVKFLQFNHWT